MRSFRITSFCLFLALVSTLVVKPIQARPSPASETVLVTSPNGAIEARFAVKEKLEPYPPGRRLYYSVSVRGRGIILDSPLGLDFQNLPPLARDLVIKGTSRRSVNETWSPAVPGKRSKVADHFNEVRMDLEEASAPRRRFAVICRAYDDGVAFRYEISQQPAIDEFRLTSERTHFHFAGNHTVWAADYKTFISHQEEEFPEIKLNQIAPGAFIGLPLLVRAAEDVWVAITEADLNDWAGMYLTGSGAATNDLVTMLSPRLDEPGVLVRAKAPRQSPWRVVMIGERPGDLIESDIVLNLSEPCALQDTAWITPGKSAWDRWWSGSYAPDADFEVGVNTATIKHFTQFAADAGFEYMLVDWWWYGDPLNPNADITQVVPEIDMPEVIRFAKERNVKILLWLRWNHVDRQMEQAFPLYEKWGVAGVKIDFMMRDDQEMVNWYRRIVKKAAEHHLVVDFHGAYKPTGLRRTYPNLLTREGVLGNEYNKWSSRITPEHTVTLPFTRMLAGPMDFTPGGFRHVMPERFRAQDSAPFVMGTRARQLAMMVIYESPLQVLCDSPYNYRGQVGLEFLRLVPTVWDETHVLEGKVADYIVIARRRGDTWYLGAMTDDAARTLEVPLDFLGEGRFTAHVFADAPEAADYPDRVSEQRSAVTSGDQLTLRMTPAGGYAAIVSPAP